MNEVKCSTCKGSKSLEFEQGQRRIPCVTCSGSGIDWRKSFDAAQAELAALREELLRLEEEYDTLEHTNITLKLNMAAAEQRNAVHDIEPAAKVLANCMDYPWEHMPENGRALMRKHAKDVVDAVLEHPTESGASE